MRKHHPIDHQILFAVAVEISAGCVVQGYYEDSSLVNLSGWVKPNIVVER